MKKKNECVMRYTIFIQLAGNIWSQVTPVAGPWPLGHAISLLLLMGYGYCMYGQFYIRAYEYCPEFNSIAHEYLKAT